MNLPVNIQPFYSVYRITNTVNGKAYIGVTKNLKRRMQAHMTLVNRGKVDLNQVRADFAMIERNEQEVER